ncbi:MAG: YitT family protein [Gammaproteobacteria bacterium]|nr:YitT family protein [Gammaproteobacteria bacterium]MBU1645268.1 YitT family protein [Gammaproteobacteria bacterium]MBU1971605.1 YitT family protein [Gammaproteobacteria bacterium]
MNTPRHTLFEDVQALLTGALVVAVGLVLIKQAGLLTGGTTGLAFLIHYGSGANFGLTLFVVNLPFYLLAWRRMGRAFTLKTIATVLLVAVLTETLPALIDIRRIDPFFAATAGGLLMGVGMLILFRHRASLGGFNILVLYLQERHGWRAGKVQMALDCTILLAATQLVAPLLLAASVLGAVLLNFALAVNHRPGRYVAF